MMFASLFVAGLGCDHDAFAHEGSASYEQSQDSSDPHAGDHQSPPIHDCHGHCTHSFFVQSHGAKVSSLLPLKLKQTPYYVSYSNPSLELAIRPPLAA